MTDKMRTPKRKAPSEFLPATSRMKTILPLVFMRPDITELPPSSVITEIEEVLMLGVDALSVGEKKKMLKYLKDWGYEW